jgi:hypothetical protein
MPMHKVKPESFIEAFKGMAQMAASPRVIENYLAMTQKLPQNAFVREAIIYHKQPLEDILKEKLSYSPYISITENNGFFIFRYNKPRSAKKDSVSGVFVILPSNQENLSRITTLSYGQFWYEGVRPILKKIYPYAMPVFFRQEEIEAALLEFENSLGGDYRIRITDVTAKEERQTSQNSEKKFYDTNRKWTDLPIKDAFIKAKETGQWFTGLHYQVQRRRKNSDQFLSQPQCSGRINKYGEISFDAISEKVTAGLIAPLEYFVSERFTLLDKRGLRERGFKPSKPIELLFDYEAFANVEEVRRFGKVIASYPNSNKAIFHSNPYYHASIADFLDGSSFDVWVVSSDRVVIIPQAKSSVPAFERIISHIFSKFGEGQIHEYTNQQ